jgi:pyruvate/2-oxoglutarate dehydrogenase complex dihydrolipoamide acyltransferase (E2) component
MANLCLPENVDQYEIEKYGPPQVSKWWVGEGATFPKGLALVAIGTGYFEFDIEVPCAGVLTKIVCPEGAIVGPGSVLAEYEPLADE